MVKPIKTLYLSILPYKQIPTQKPKTQSNYNETKSNNPINTFSKNLYKLKTITITNAIYLKKEY